MLSLYVYLFMHFNELIGLKYQWTSNTTVYDSKHKIQKFNKLTDVGSSRRN